MAKMQMHSLGWQRLLGMSF